MNAVLHSIQSVMFAIVWYYVATRLWARWLSDPRGEDLQQVSPTCWVQTGKHHNREILAHLALWLGLWINLVLAFAAWLPQQPQAAAHRDDSEQDTKDAGNRRLPRVTVHVPTRHEPRLVLVVDPLADASKPRADAQPDKCFPQGWVVADCDHANEYGAGDNRHGAIPLVRSPRLLDIHAPLSWSITGKHTRGAEL